MAQTWLGVAVVTFGLSAIASAQPVAVLHIQSQETADDGMVVLVLESGARIRVPATISRYETAKEAPSMTNALRLAAVLKCRLDQFVAGADPGL